MKSHTEIEPPLGKRNDKRQQGLRLMQPMKATKQTLAFRPRARLVSILGEHLISDQAVGLIELVKNSYDADATEVLVSLSSLASADNTIATVLDNGSGMSLEDIEKKWFSPAVDDKEQAKKRGERTALGRLPIGEKGVGRFAAQQIGRRLELITRKQDCAEVVVNIDWDVFDKGQEYLDTVSIDVVERTPEVFPDQRTGTRLIMRRARQQWSENLLKKVHRTLRRLQSPLQEDQFRFRVRFECPEYPEYETIDPTDLLEKAHYEFRAIVDQDGQCDFEYVSKHPAVAARSLSNTENLVNLAAEDLHLQAAAPSCGSFWINLYVWDRSQDYLQSSGVSRKELDAQCGVSLFRDGLRVLPYGEPGDDWLFLDQERIQAPAERIGNNQVIGLVQFDQSSNLLLRDKTNREGLIENDAFLDLRALVRAAIRVFSTHWKKDRPVLEKRQTTVKGSLDVAKRVATALRDSVRDDIDVEIPPDIPDVGATNDSEAAEAEVIQQTRTMSQRRALEILIENIDGAAVSAREREQRIDRLLTLAATGLAAERVVHEFGRQVQGALSALNAFRRTVRAESKSEQTIDILSNCLQTLRSEFRIIAPYEVAERDERPRELSLREASELALTLNKETIENNEIQANVEGHDFNVIARSASVVQIIDNLVHNSCYWLGSVKNPGARKLQIILDKSSSRLIVADSGSGIPEHVKPHLFEPFFSMKAGGTGLGLYISHEIARRMSAELKLFTDSSADVLPSWASGAAFSLEFDVSAASKKDKRRYGGT
jgi:signal transduction histidine kinase